MYTLVQVAFINYVCLFAYKGESIASIYSLAPTVAVPPGTPNVVVMSGASSDVNDCHEIPFANPIIN